VILLFSLSKAALHSQLVDKEAGHIDKVNDICWSPTFSDSVYSCSDDGNIVEWSLLDAKLKQKFRASKTPVTAISVDSTSTFMLTASKTIAVWDLTTKTPLKTFIGHSQDIFNLSFLGNNTNSDKFFISSAANDRVLNAWSFDSNTKPSSSASMPALASFNINDGAIYTDFVNVTMAEQDQPYALILAITEKGHLHLYFHQMMTTAATGEKKKNKLKKPIKAINQLKLETTNASGPIRILGAFVTNKSNERIVDLKNAKKTDDNTDLMSSLIEATQNQYIHIVYGSQLNPKIEKLTFNELLQEKEKVTVLKREDPFASHVHKQTESTKVETPGVAKDLKVLAPGFMHPLANNMTSNNSMHLPNTASAKRKTIVEPGNMSLEDRLNVMGIENCNGSSSQDATVSGGIPKTDNLLVLLQQGLQSNDAKMLNHVLQHKNEKLIAKTVRLLPHAQIVSLVRELNKRLQGHAQSGMSIIKWLKCVLMIHTSYLMSYPELIEMFGSVYEMMNARTKLFPQLSKLQGKLQLVMSQVSSQAEALQTANEKDVQPLLYYQDSASEDEQIEDELIPSHSEYDDYNFSDEEVDDDEVDDDMISDDEMDQAGGDQVDESIRKEVVSFKKKKQFSGKKNKKDESDDDSSSGDEVNGVGIGSSDDSEDDDDSEADEDQDSSDVTTI